MKKSIEHLIEKGGRIDEHYRRNQCDMGKTKILRLMVNSFRSGEPLWRRGAAKMVVPFLPFLRRPYYASPLGQHVDISNYTTSV